MGMFDSVFVTCPWCHKSTERQTKTGDSMLRSYTLDNVPMDAAAGVLGADYCKYCRKKSRVEIVNRPTYRIVKDEGEDS